MSDPNANRLVQISRHVLREDRVPIGEEPVFETYLDPNQQIVSFYTNSTGGPERKTEDHYAVLWVATRFSA